ncbi:ATP-binding protein [Bacillus cereus group sp. Bc252]|uniref:ATP-binding protein n=2 Tax=Bacillaceae TaxID=186817 RepID=UPI00211D78A9|nr:MULTISPECIES: ATP-binding protein [Bacillus cereus group]MCU5209422.1 ATP-binding protein [Bacillus paranthracis]MDA2161306.1 ATP-binding protein [Bacillus cereus group sp. Bc252]MDG1611130.1 ATP-binding protein [Bacillus paranthracis]
MGGLRGMEVMVPQRFNRSTMYELLEAIIDEDLKPKAEEITFNFRKLKFIEPAGVTILGNLFEWLNKNGVTCDKILPRSIDGRDAVRYLDDSLFFEQYFGEKLREQAGLRPTTIPLNLVSYANSYQFLRGRFAFWLANRLDVTVESVKNITVSMEEIFNNIRDHAQENTGCIFAQHYPNKDGENTVHITISDFGVGIPHNIQKEYPSMDDGEALNMAITAGFSTRSTPRNRGVGLATLVDNVVKDLGGEVYIHSNHGILTCKAGNNDSDVEYNVSPSYYPGTLIQIKLKADNIENIISDEEDFGEWD